MPLWGSADLLQAENLSIRGFNKPEINIILSSGSRIGIMGGPGSGKTSLLRALARLDPLNDGKLYWAQLDVSRKLLWRMKKQRNYVSMLFANPYTLFESGITVSQLLQDTVKNVGMPLVELLHENGIPGVVLAQPINSLSGVLRVRLALLLLRQNQSAVVLVDDVFRFLVPGVWQEMREVIGGVVSAHQALVMVSQFHAGLELMDHILVLHQGRLVEGGPKEEVFHHPAHPVTQSLISGRFRELSGIDVRTAELQLDRDGGGAVQVSPGHWVLASD